MRPALLMFFFLSACKVPAQPAPAPSRDAAVSAAPGTADGNATVTDPSVSARAACVDAKLTALHLNLYGDPLDTVYAGGTPLFDETTSVTRDRIGAILVKHPDLERACPAR